LARREKRCPESISGKLPCPAQAAKKILLAIPYLVPDGFARMQGLRILTASEQVAAHLREALGRGFWNARVPGVNGLARDLGVANETVETALRLLEREGLLVGQGPGRRRRIVIPEGEIETTRLRVGLLVHDFDRLADELSHLLKEAGHIPVKSHKTLLDLGMDAKRVAGFVRQAKADAWVVFAASREVLVWFAEQETPVFALFGQRHGLPIAGTGPDKGPAFAEITRRLIALGHQRISLLGRASIRLPQPLPATRAFLGELEAAKIGASAYNLPDWEETSEGFERILNSLFAVTPPTALILCEPFLYHAAHHHLARRDLRVPKDVSLVCTDGDPTFVWCRPEVAHIRWDYRPVLRRIVRWTNHIARGKEDRRQTSTKAEFVEGGTVGPAPKR
jgi:DNA-binding transcriptional regulator YhcF (GntR family)